MIISDEKEKPGYLFSLQISVIGSCSCNSSFVKFFVLRSNRQFISFVCYCSSETCCLEYTITLLRVTEPLEDRMEQALFSPPLSKQRVEYAVQSIKESCATTLVNEFLFYSDFTLII